MDKGNFFKRNIRAIVFFILNLILFSGLLSCVILYVNKTRSNFIEQNISQVESVNNAAGELSINYLNHESTDVTDLTNYASIKYQDGTFKDINDLANYFYDSNSVRDVAYEIIGTDYKGIVCLKDSEGNFPSISYTNSSYAKIQEIFLAAKTGEHNKAFVSSEFSDQYSALKSFAIYSYFEMKSSSGEDLFYTIMQIIDSQSFQDLIYFNGGYKDISTVLLDSDGVYIVLNPTFKASSFFRYLYINNNLTLSQMNAIHDEVIEKKSGYLTYKDSRNEDAVFVYNEVDETREWFTITVLPMKDFKVFSESNIYIYFILAILGVIAVSDTFYFYIINRKVKEAYARSQKASLAKSEFLSRMSHDIRTPLNGIIGLTNIILDNNELNPKVRESEEEVLTASDFLLSLLNDILDMSKIEAKKMELYPTPYFKEEMAKYLNAVIQPLCDKKSIEFKVNFDTKDNIGINIDKQRLNQIVFNLLSNAVKFTPNGGNVTLSFSLDDLKKKMRIVVKDNGQGMSKEFQKEMFESFTQEHRNETNSTGTGLGLSIVYQLVKLMDGNIVVNSEINKGSTFTINIPVELVSWSINVI